MGKKERLRRVGQSKLIKDQQRKISDRQYLEREMFKLRVELSSMRTKFSETLVRITNEIRNQRSNQTIFDRILTTKGLICKDDAKKAMDEIEEETSKMFNPDGSMVGTPAITCYNCDFDVDVDGVETNKINSLKGDV